MADRAKVSAGPRPGSTVRGLALTCHPIPAVAVAVFAGLLGVLASLSVTRCLVLVAAVLCGQLSIGWSNDRIDAARDATVGRVDKPLAAGAIGRPVVDRAIGVALAATVLLSFSLGPRAAIVHLIAVGCGWAYNLGFKSTRLSWLPYAVAFGLLPVVAGWAAPRPSSPPLWLVLAAVLLGVVGHLANALPDLDDDGRTGVRSAPYRLGAQRSLVLSGVLVLAAAMLVAFGPSGRPGAAGWAGLAAGAGLAVLLAGAHRWRDSRRAAGGAFQGLILIVAVQLAVLVLAPGRWR